LLIHEIDGGIKRFFLDRNDSCKCLTRRSQRITCFVALALQRGLPIIRASFNLCLDLRCSLLQLSSDLVDFEPLCGQNAALSAKCATAEPQSFPEWSLALW
jgi:hypothetical protein